MAKKYQLSCDIWVPTDDCASAYIQHHLLPANDKMSKFVGKIHVRQENPTLLSRCIQDSPGAFSGILHAAGETQLVVYTEEDRDFFYELPPWVSLARSWDDLDRFIREFNDHITGPTQTNTQRSYSISKILARPVGDDGVVEYRAPWLNYNESQSTVVTKEAISNEVTNPVSFFEEVDEKLDSGEPAPVNVTMADPPSSWRWRCAWMHLVAPRGVAGFLNRHLKVSEKTSFFIQKIVGLGLAAIREDNSDEAGAEGQAATRQDYNTSTDYNSGQPRCLSYGVHSLLDSGRIPRILGAPRMPAAYEKITQEKTPNAATEKNPYEVSRMPRRVQLFLLFNISLIFSKLVYSFQNWYSQVSQEWSHGNVDIDHFYPRTNFAAPFLQNRCFR